MARVMAHLVAGFPDMEESLQVARALFEGGCDCLEVQFPFSDPTADGPWIQKACHSALRAGFRVADGFRLIGEIARLAPVPVFLMSYASPVIARGVDAFVDEARRAGAVGLIVPDLPVDADEGLYALGRAAGLHVVPVVVPGIREERLRLVAATGTEYLYAALRAGITGATTRLGEENFDFLRRLARLGRRVIAGFGVNAREQVAALAPHVHAVVVGSAFVREILSASGTPAREAVRARMAALRAPAAPGARPQV